eukprot:3314377-Rhodomonas_salina.2
MAWVRTGRRKALERTGLWEKATFEDLDTPRWAHVDLASPVGSEVLKAPCFVKELGRNLEKEHRVSRRGTESQLLVTVSIIFITQSPPSSPHPTPLPDRHLLCLIIAATIASSSPASPSSPPTPPPQSPLSSSPGAWLGLGRRQPGRRTTD